MESLAGKVAVVTGASRGIGIEIARALGSERAQIVLAARSASELEAVRSDLGAAGVEAVAVPTDVGKLDSLENLVAKATETFGSVDVLVNNAGIEMIAGFDSISFQEIEATFRVNLLGLAWLTRLVVPGMIARASGHIVNIASNAGMVGVPYNAAYSASKHGVIGLSRSLRGELKPHNIGVSVVCPGFVEGERITENFDGKKPPMMAGTVTKGAVAKAVLGAIHHNRGEVIVNKGLGKIVDWFEAMAPDFTAGTMRRTGIEKLFREAAKQKRG